MTEITSIVYSSNAMGNFRTREDRQQLKTHSQTANAKRGITGLLIFAEGTFVQVIEGPAAEIDPLYAKIAQDLRHSEVKLLARSQGPTRLFSKWSMGIIETEDEPEPRVSLDDRLHAIAKLSLQTQSESVPTSRFIEAFLDPEAVGIKHVIA